MVHIYKNHKNLIITLLAFLVPAFLMLAIAAAGQYAPFGKVSILVADMQYQFVDYIGYLKSVFFGNNDLLYSFSKTFGGDMSGFSAYYLNNPFFYLLLFCPNDLLPVGILLMMILICGGCGLTFQLMLRGIWGNRLISVIFSTAYAMMGFMMAYINCIHYFFSIMMLPLVILGLFKMCRSRKSSLTYIISVTLTIISCYYIGYMILIFTAVFFLFILFSGIVQFEDIKDRLKTAWLVIYTTFLSIGISAFTLFSVVLSLRGQKSSGLQFSFSRNFNIFELFSGLYSGSFKGNISDGLPIIYSSVIAVVFLLLYFLNRKISLCEKILSALLFGFMAAGFWIDAFNVAWHGFAHPIGFPYRNSFLFSFLVIFFAYRGFLMLQEGFAKYQVNIVLVIFAVYSLYLYFIHSSYADISVLAISGAIVATALICIVSMSENNKYVIPALACLTLIQMFDLYNNGLKSVDAYYDDKDDESVSLSEYKKYIDETESLVNAVKNYDDSMYRMDKLYRRTHNDPMMFSYNGLSHFSSCETDQVKRFMGRLGYRDNGNWAFYGQGSTSFADCLMSLKYMLSQYDETCKPYQQIYSENEKYVYQNPYALSFGFGMKDKVRSVDAEEDSSDLFAYQNELAGCFTGASYEIYRPVDVKDVILSNVTQDGYIYRRNSSEEAYVEYVLSVDRDDFIYMYFDAPTTQDAALTVNGMSKEPYFTLYDWCIRECGYFEPGQEVRVRFTLEDDELEIDDYKFYYENQDILKLWYKDASATKCDMTKITSSHLLADVDMDKDSDLLVFSIPYEEDWNIYVDGKKVKQEKVLDALMAVPLSEGEHHIEMRYIPRGYVIGIPVSIIALITTFCVIFYQKKKKPQVKK